ncbi:hypothetical protein [Ramlibacter alkalitolerans]|uniref:Uncharacterized protein n=1 Tax=Ramlibacter alkalitolerans TaxID=2039631 RepID=A0ABS1JTQ5_9BURK|nr:hypothetical protein [Ramlibacter alkalitolerans]MBL0427684.1 hypothetical protein [Ramlibacter alkalitolerans]
MPTVIASHDIDFYSLSTLTWAAALPGRTQEDVRAVVASISDGDRDGRIDILDNGTVRGQALETVEMVDCNEAERQFLASWRAESGVRIHMAVAVDGELASLSRVDVNQRPDGDRAALIEDAFAELEATVIATEKLYPVMEDAKEFLGADAFNVRVTGPGECTVEPLGEQEKVVFSVNGQAGPGVISADKILSDSYPDDDNIVAFKPAEFTVEAVLQRVAEALPYTPAKDVLEQFRTGRDALRDCLADLGLDGGDLDPPPVKDSEHPVFVARVAKLDAVMQQVQRALESCEDTRMLAVSRRGDGLWAVESPADNQVLDIDLQRTGDTSIVGMELFENDNPADDCLTIVPIDDLTVEAVLEDVVDRLGYGTVEEVLASGRAARAATERLDTVMGEVQAALKADAGTQLLHAWRNGEGCWLVENEENAEQLQFLMGHEDENLIAVELFRDDPSEPVADSFVPLDARTITAREVVEQVVSQLQCGGVESILESGRTEAERLALVKEAEAMGFTGDVSFEDASCTFLQKDLSAAYPGLSAVIATPLTDDPDYPVMHAIEFRLRDEELSGAKGFYGSHETGAAAVSGALHEVQYMEQYLPQAVALATARDNPAPAVEQVPGPGYVVVLSRTEAGIKASAQLREGDTILQRMDIVAPDKEQAVKLAKEAIRAAIASGKALDAPQKAAKASKKERSR